MNLKPYFFILINLILISMLFLYFISPGEKIELNLKDTNHNFTLENQTIKTQFYENMRFPTNNISYKINEDCTLKKKNDMERAFEIIENLTVLSFYSTNENEEITIGCEEKNKIEEGMFIAGEGGPTNITETTNYNVILHGNILLIRDSECSTPNVAMHELLHVLGFDHSENKNNLMYPISKCSQTIGEELPILIEELYHEEPFPDLSIEEATANLDGRDLDLNISIRNEGLKDSKKAKIIVYAGNRTIKEFELEPIKIGYGIKITVTNIWVTKIKIEELKIAIETNFEELDKSNNEVLLTKNY